MRTTYISIKAFLLTVVVCVGMPSFVYAASEAEQSAASEEIKVGRAKVMEAQVAKDLAVKTRDALAAQQASKPSPDTERKLKDADYEVMMADSKLSSANKSVERAQKKLGDSSVEAKTLQAQPAAKIEKPAVVVSQENSKAADDLVRKEAETKLAVQKASEDAAKKTAAELARKEAEAKLAAQKTAAELARKEAEAKLAAQKTAEEQARKETEAKLAAQKASEDAAQKIAQAEAAAKKQALAIELGIDKNCIALPTAPTNPSASSTEADQAYAQGFLKQLNQLIAKRTMDDVPPISPFPVLEGSKLNPCDPDQKLALKFGYSGNGQYRLETPVLAGEQEFIIKNVVQPLNRTIPDADNGEVYVFFLDGREGRTKLSAYKKSLFVQTSQ